MKKINKRVQAKNKSSKKSYQASNKRNNGSRNSFNKDYKAREFETKTSKTAKFSTGVEHNSSRDELMRDDSRNKALKNKSRFTNRGVSGRIAKRERSEERSLENIRDNTVRLHKYLADCGVASRRACEDFIKAGRVKVNETIASIGMSITARKDQVYFDDKLVKPIPLGAAVFNKPDGVVSTLSDPHGRRSISDYIPEHLKSYFPVGRLDFESIGLVILTNDGELADRLLHPKYLTPRKYHIRVTGTPSEKILKQASKGVKLDDGVVKAEVRFLRAVENATWLEVVLHVGKNRVVRRMFEALGYPVQKLMRVAHGPFNLGKLQSGEVKELTDRQYRRVREMVMKGFTKFPEKFSSRKFGAGAFRNDKARVHHYDYKEGSDFKSFHKFHQVETEEGTPHKLTHKEANELFKNKYFSKKQYK